MNRRLGSLLVLWAWAQVSPPEVLAQAVDLAAARAYLQPEPTGPKFGHAWIRRARELRAAAIEAGPPGPPPGRYALSGTFNVAVVAATYAGVEPSYASSDYASVYFGATDDGKYSLNEFYREASGGAFGFDGAVTPWIALDSTATYYLEGKDRDGRGRWTQYAYDALVEADALVDWRQYDNDGPDGVPDSGDDDGYVDMVIFLHPFADGVCSSGGLSGPTSTGWRLELAGGPFEGAPFRTSATGASGEPLLVDDFVLTAGLRCGSSGIATPNIAIHEMGHALGLPDLYDRDGSSAGVGVWDVMGLGVYATADVPTQFGAWTRRQLGWVTVEALRQGAANVVLEPTLLSGRVVRIDVPGTQEYYLVENRQPVLADAGLPGGGIVVWRVDDEVLLARLPTYAVADDDDHPGLAVLQADGLLDLRHRNNSGDAGDPFPGSGGVTSLSDGTPVNLKGYGGDRSHTAFTGIVQTGADMSFDVEVVYPPLAFADGSVLPGGLLGEVGYEQPIPVTGGAGDLTFTALDGVPPGMVLRSDGRLTGAPRALGTSRVRFEVADDVGQSLTGEVEVSVTMPAITQDDAIDAVLLSPSVSTVERRALDLLGNQNGRLDVGDVWAAIAGGWVR
jgi:M6 family metalloprotease-like protein